MKRTGSVRFSIKIWMILVPMLTSVAIATFYLGGWFAQTMSPFLAYPLGFLSGIVITVIGTIVIGDVPTTTVEIGVGAVVTLIISAILFPVFAQANDRARSLTCQENLRAFGTAFGQYALDYDDALPPGIRWGEVTSPYLPHSKKRDQFRNRFACPAAPKLPFGYAARAGDPVLYDSDRGQRNAWDSVPMASLPRRARHCGKDAVLFQDGHVALWKRGTAASRPRMPLYTAVGR